MPGRAAHPLQRRAHHRIADVLFDVERRAEFLRLFRRHPLVLDPGQPVGVDVALEHLHVMHRVGQHHHAALGIHDVVIEVLRQPVPQVQRMLVEGGAFLPQIVGAHDGGVAARVAATQPALVQHRYIGDAMHLGQVIGGGQPVAARADDDDVIGGLWLRGAPLVAPVLVRAEGVFRQFEKGIARHGRRQAPCHGVPLRRRRAGLDVSV